MTRKLSLFLTALAVAHWSGAGFAPHAHAAEPNVAPVVHLLAPDPLAAEEGSVPAHFLAVRTGPTNEALTVLYEIGGRASNGEDYEELPGTVTIPAGSHSASITVTPVDDFEVEGWESVILALRQPPVWPPAYIVSWPSVAAVYIEDNDLPPTNQPPAVAVVNPPDGAVFVAPVNLTLVARASDPDGRVMSVEFFDGTNSLGVVTNSNWSTPTGTDAVSAQDGDLLMNMNPTLYPDPNVEPTPIPVGLYRLVWSNVPPGDHVLTAVATDDRGASTTSSAVDIQIIEAPVQPVLTVTAPDPEAAEPDPGSSRLDTATFQIARTGATNFPLTVWYRLSGTASNGLDYQELPLSVTIPEGESSVDVVIEPIDDPIVEGDESVVLSIVPPICPAIFPPPPDCYRVGQPNVARAVIHDNDVPANQAPLVSLVRPLDGSVFLAPAKIDLVAQAFDPDGHVVTVEFFEGTNSLGIVTNDTSGASSLRPPFQLVWPDVAAGRYVLAAVATDDDGASGRSRPVEITVVTHPVPPVVNIVATDPVATEPGVLTVVDTATFELTRTGSTDDPLWVFYSIGGTASNGVDYQELPARMEIPAGATSANIVVNPLDDDLVEGVETVVIRLQEPPLMSASPLPIDYYAIGSNDAARVIIRDNDTSFTNIPPEVALVRPENGEVFMAPATIPLYAAAFDRDGVVRSVEFFEGANSLGIVSNNAAGPGPTGPGGMGGNANTDLRGVDQLFRLVWNNVPPGSYELTAKATDDDGATAVSEPVHIRVAPPLPPVVTIEATDPDASEGPVPVPYVDASGRTTIDRPISNMVDTGRFTVRRSRGTNTPLTVSYSLGGTASNGVDYRELSGQVTIPAGSCKADIVVVPIDDDQAEGTETVIAELRPAPVPLNTYPVEPAYVVGDPHRAVVYIHDNDLNLSPRVEIVKPADQSVFVAPADIEINVLAIDPDGWVPRVQFYADDVLIGEREIVFIMPPQPGQPQTFSLTWTNAPLGDHVLVARAIDNQGAVSASDPVPISVVREPAIPVVTIQATVPWTQEQDPRLMMPLRPAMFQVTRHGGDLSQALRVFYRISGTASNGVDYQMLSGEVTIPTNAVSAEIYVVAIDDDLVEGTEAVVLTLEQLRCVTTNTPPVSGCYIVGEPGQAVAYIRDNDSPPNQAPKVAILDPPNGAVFTAPANIRLVAAAEDADGWVATVEFFAGTNSLGVVTNRPWIVEPVRMPYLNGATLSGLATPSIPIPPPFTLQWPKVPAGQYVLTAVASDNEGASTRSAPVEITVTESNAPPTVSIMATDPFAQEGTANTATFRVRRVGRTNDPLTVLVAISGSASNGVDYARIPNTVTIPAGHHTAKIVIDPLADNLTEGIETVILTLTPSPLDVFPPPYVVGQPDKAGAVIVDTDWPDPLTERLPDGHFHLRLPLPNGLPYRLEASTDLIHWEPVVDQVMAGENGVGYVEPGDRQLRHRFYRVVPEVDFQADQE